jgi:undecaprenyl-diphosphatase
LSFVAAFIAIWFMMALLKRMSMLPFVVYRFALGAFLFVIVYG